MQHKVVEGKGGITARAVADSIGAAKVRLTTLELVYPRFIHSEFMTHRVFSRNASSSRAIPVEKTIRQVIDKPATPIHWGKNQPGMQAHEEISDELRPFAIRKWKEAAQEMAGRVDHMLELNVHKQVLNRLLEPFQFINVVVTATEWRNFFELRLHKDAQPEIHELARVMDEALRSSVPTPLRWGNWHTPYALDSLVSIEKRIVSSVAGCARVSYKNHDQTERTYEKDLKLYEMLKASGHMSPFEHQACPIQYGFHSWDEWEYWSKGITHVDREGTPWSNNFRYWIQERARLEW